ncbi:phosphopantetheine-binding protein, partial [Streptomyces noursei]
HLAGGDLARLARAGVAPMPTEEGLALFDAALTTEQPVLVPMRLDTAGLRRGAEADIPPVFADLVSARRPHHDQGAVPSRSGEPSGPSWLERVGVLRDEARHEAVMDFVRDAVATVLGHSSPVSIDAQLPLQEIGFDSLTAVELRNRLNRVTGFQLPTTLAFDHPSVEAIANHLLNRLAPNDEDRQLAALDALDQLVRSIADGAADKDGARMRRLVEQRLREATARLAGAGLAEDTPLDAADGTAPGLVHATDDELFEFLDGEIGS